MQTDLSFQQACEQLQNFLQTEKRPHVIHWIFREDVLLFKRNILLRWPLPTDNERQAEKLFCLGKAKGLGLALAVYGVDHTNAYGYVLVPTDQADSEALMMADLKLSYLNDQRKIVKIRTAIAWQIVKRLLPKMTNLWVEDLMPPRNSI